MESIDIIIPCKDEEENIEHIYSEIMKLEPEVKKVGDVNLNIIFIDDGSKDNTSKCIKKLSEQYKNVSYVIFSKNFGKESAIYAGLKKSIGDYAVIMDCDMQDPPIFIVDMYKFMKEGFEAVGTKRKNRVGEPIIRSFFSNSFYNIFNMLSKTQIPNGMRDFCMMSVKFKNAILSNMEKNRFFKGLFCNVGFKVKWIEFENVNRYKGNTKWSFKNLLFYSIEGLLSFSNMPILVSSIVGIICCIISFITMLFVVIRAIIYGDRVIGWPSMVSIMLFLQGLQFLFIGVIGIYISKNYIELKNRPLYFVEEES